MLLRETIPPGSYRSLMGALEGTPFLFLLPLAGRAAPRRVAHLGWVAALSFLAVIATSPGDGGLQGGSRLLLPSAVLALAAALTRLAEAPRPARLDRWQRAALVALLLVAVPLSSRSLPFLLYRKADVDRPALEEIRRTPADILMVTNANMPQGLAATYWERPMVHVWDEATIGSLLDRLAAAGGSRALMVSVPGVRSPARLPVSPGEPARWIRTSQGRITLYQLDAYQRVPGEER